MGLPNHLYVTEIHRYFRTTRLFGTVMTIYSSYSSRLIVPNDIGNTCNCNCSNIPDACFVFTDYKM